MKYSEGEKQRAQQEQQRQNRLNLSVPGNETFSLVDNGGLSLAEGSYPLGFFDRGAEAPSGSIFAGGGYEVADSGQIAADAGDGASGPSDVAQSASPGIQTFAYSDAGSNLGAPVPIAGGGLPLAHSTSGMSTSDPLPGSILSGDYTAQNDVLLSKEQRSERIGMLLKSREDVLRSTGERYGIDPRSVAAVITWEFTENTRGYLSDQLLPASQQNGYGWGQIHDSTLRNELIPGTSLDNSIALRSNLDSAIDLVGARVRQQADTYFSLTGIDLSSNPSATAWLFNTSRSSVENSATIQLGRISQGLTPMLNIQNNMAQWASQNIDQFQWLTPKNPVANQGISYGFAVSGEPK